MRRLCGGGGFPDPKPGRATSSPWVLIIAVWFLEPRLLARIKIIFAGALVAILLLPSLLDRFERLQGVDDATELSRFAVWQAAGTMFLEHPILGVGYGNYRGLFGYLSPQPVLSKVDAHNLYLQLLAETDCLDSAALPSCCGRPSVFP